MHREDAQRFEACRFDFRLDSKNGLTPSKRKRSDRRNSCYNTLFKCKVRVVGGRWGCGEGFSRHTLFYLIEMSLGPIYTDRQRQYSVNAGMTLAIFLSLNTTESLQNGLQSIWSNSIVFNERSVAGVSSLRFTKLLMTNQVSTCNSPHTFRGIKYQLGC